MKTLGKRILLKINEKTDELGVKVVDNYEVAHIGDEVTKLKVGDIVIYEQGAKLNILGVDYIDIQEESVVAII